MSDKLIEAVAVAISGAPFSSPASIRKARAALQAIEAAGFRVVSADTLSPEQIAEFGALDGPVSRGNIGLRDAYFELVRAAPRIAP